MKFPKVIIPQFLSANCPDHWENIILWGRCWKHDEEKREEALKAKWAKV